MNRYWLALGLLSLPVFAQEPAPAPAKAPTRTFQIEAGQRVPLSVLKTISTRSAIEGDPVYLATTFPILSGGRIVIPTGSYVTGTITGSKRAGKVKGRAELRMRLETIILPNGITHDFRGNLGGLDSANGETLDRAEGTIKGKGNKVGDLKTVGTVASYGAMTGAAVGGLSTIGQTGPNTSDPTSVNNSLYRQFRRPMIGSGIGLAGGAAAGLIATLLTRGPDATLSKGTDLEMVLDRTVIFDDSELVGLPAPPPGAVAPPPPGLKERAPADK
jgi:hypothetical protein